MNIKWGEMHVHVGRQNNWGPPGLHEGCGVPTRCVGKAHVGDWLAPSRSRAPTGCRRVRDPHRSRCVTRGACQRPGFQRDPRGGRHRLHGSQGAGLLLRQRLWRWDKGAAGEREAPFSSRSQGKRGQIGFPPPPRTGWCHHRSRGPLGGAGRSPGLLATSGLCSPHPHPREDHSAVGPGAGLHGGFVGHRNPGSVRSHSCIWGQGGGGGYRIVPAWCENSTNTGTVGVRADSRCAC